MFQNRRLNERHVLVKSGLLAVLTVMALSLNGCGQANPKCIPAVCQLTIDGKPVGPATAIFSRVDAKPTDRRSTATIDKDGEGKFSTFQAGDGIPEGEYKVTVVSGSLGRSPIAKAYGDEAKTPLKAQVFANSDVIKLELEAVKTTSTPGTSGLERFGAKSSQELMEEATNPKN
jgi:hypothetical protein